MMHDTPIRSFNLLRTGSQKTDIMTLNKNSPTCKQDGISNWAKMRKQLKQLTLTEKNKMEYNHILQ